MANLFLKDQNLEQSPPIVGYEIMKFMSSKKRREMSVFDVAERFQNESWFSVDNLYLGVIFLYSVGLIDFNAPYLVANAAA
ncbi:hypothetical protein [Rhizobium hidalgonense]|uniref:hypothetical protein n=1 Tax=Rhizobium hidalgonense TaxID=1538159 RepID=UPI0028720E57|nr:hypothetical protein [Rhizobium hidalgonense]MDR9807961.1 hypothetical protein [Rhizobium hidalgonense]